MIVKQRMPMLRSKRLQAMMKFIGLQEGLQKKAGLNL